MYAEERRDLFQPLWYLIIWPYHAGAGMSGTFAQHRNRRRLLANYLVFTAGIYSLFALGLVCGVLWTMLFFWGPACLYWDGVSDWYSEPD